MEIDGFMDNYNRSPFQADEPVVIDAAIGQRTTLKDTANHWKATLLPEARQRIVGKIMDILMRHLPFNGQEGLLELEKIAVRFEEKIYDSATCQGDYLRKISLKLMNIEIQHNAIQANPANNGLNPASPDFATELDEGEVCNPSPITPVQVL